ncbi:MAG: ion transporter [Nanoarchaeota archaeon]|nr:ion transporter [Nanoarchaeota archaeon]
MKKGFHKVERFVDTIVPYMVVLLMIIIIISLFFHELALDYHLEITILDYIIVTTFAVDLVFKYIRIRKIKKFIKLYWLDILAVFPFYLFLRAVEEVYLIFRVSDTLKEGQSILHAGIGLSELGAIDAEANKIIKESESVAKFSRSRFALRFLRPITRVPRLLKILPYYEKATGKHHIHDKK